MKTKIARMLLSILSLALARVAHGGDDIPQRLAFQRYDSMLQKSPFKVATVTAAPVAAPSVFKDLYVANAAHTDQADLVTVLSASDKNFREYLTTEQPNEHGYGIANIEWSDQKGQTKVTISKDGQFGTIGFNEAFISQSSPNTSVPAPGSPNAMPTPFPTPVVQRNIPRPPQYPVVATPPPPHVRPVIQRNPRVEAVPMPPNNLVTVPDDE